MELCNGMMGEDMRDIFIIINLIRKANIYIEMARFSKVDFRMEKNKVQDKLGFLMELFIEVIGKMI
jgi:hypothetical protein